MNNYDAPNHLVPTWSAHNTSRSLGVALALVLAPFLSAVALTYPTLATAFAAGVGVAAGTVAVSRLSRRFRQRPRAERN